MGQFVSENWPMWRGAGGQSTGGPPAVTSSTDLLHSGLYPFVESLAKLCQLPMHYIPQSGWVPRSLFVSCGESFLGKRYWSKVPCSGGTDRAD